MKYNQSARTWIILLGLSIFSCSIREKVPSDSDIENCLILDPLSYNNSTFNPKWLSENGVKKIIQREYLDGRNGKIHLVNVLYFNPNGYLKTKYSGLSYPKNDLPNEGNISSKQDYVYEYQDSFLIQKWRTVRFYDQNGKMKEPDTLRMVKGILNLKLASSFKNEKREVVREYRYDNIKRLFEVMDGKGKSMFKLQYISKDKVRIGKYSHWHERYVDAWLTFNSKGQIIKNYDESNTATHEFFYNKKGEMIEEKSYFKNKEPNYMAYEYVRL